MSIVFTLAGKTIEIEFSIGGQYAYIGFFGKEYFKDFSGNEPLISADDMVELETTKLRIGIKNG